MKAYKILPAKSDLRRISSKIKRPYDACFGAEHTHSHSNENVTVVCMPCWGKRARAQPRERHHVRTCESSAIPHDVFVNLQSSTHSSYSGVHSFKSQESQEYGLRAHGLHKLYPAVYHSSPKSPVEYASSRFEHVIRAKCMTCIRAKIKYIVTTTTLLE